MLGRMSTNAWFYTLLLLGTAFEIVGDLLFKRWVTVGRFSSLAWGLAIYLVGAALWAVSLRFGPLAKAAVVFAVANTLALSLSGLILFDERLGLGHVLGIGLGVLSVAVLETAD